MPSELDESPLKRVRCFPGLTDFSFCLRDTLRDKSTFVVQSRTNKARSGQTDVILGNLMVPSLSALKTKMVSWFLYWRVQKKFPDLTGTFAVGCTGCNCAKNESVGVTSDAGSFIRFFFPLEKDGGKRG